METVYVNANDPNFFEEYNVEVRQDQEEWIDKLRELREQIFFCFRRAYNEQKVSVHIQSPNQKTAS